jgi:catecholate siderophore receptor
MNRPTPIALALLTLCAAIPARSQDAPATPATLREVRVESGSATDFGANQNSLERLGASLRDIPQSMTVINQSLMQSQGATSLASALRNVPGLTLGAAEGGQIGNNINLNGFSARTDVFLDGGRDRGQYYRDVFALDAIEVLMGPSSMLFGRGSTGGVINQVSKQPRLKPSTDASASVTTNGLVRSTIDVDRPLSETSAFRIAAMAQQGNATSRDQNTVQDFGLAPSVKFGIGTPTRITLSALLQHNRDMADYGLPPLNGAPAQVNRKTAFGFSDDRTVQDVTAFNALIEHRFSQSLSIRNQTQFNQVVTDARETAPQTIGLIGPAGFTALNPANLSGAALGTLGVRLQSHDRRVRDTSLFNQTELSAKFETGTMKHSLLAGFELGHDQYNNQNSVRNGFCNGVPMNTAGAVTGYVGCEALVNPVYSATPANAPSTPANLATGSATTLGMYANDTLEINPRFKLVGGLRHDRYAASISNSINSSNTAGNTTLARADQTVGFTSVRAGALWQPDDVQSWYVSYSTSFNPSLEQLVSTTGISQPLPPQRNRAWEIGGKWEPHGGNLSLNAAAFQITQFNARSQNSDNTYSATGTVRVNGARAGASGRVTDKVQVFAGYTLLDAKIIDAVAVGTQGNTPLNTPRHSANLWSSWGFMPNWELGGGFVHVSRRFANNTNLVAVPDYMRWDSSLTWRQPGYEVRLNLFNLFNKAYYDALITSDGGRAVPGSSRSAMLSVNYRF